MKELKIRLYGRPASKKNSRVNLPNGVSFPSKAYRAFHKSAMEQLNNYNLMPGMPIQELVKITYTFHVKGKYKQDSDNAMASINDVLQDAGIIVDDDIIDNWSGEKIRGCKEWMSDVLLEYK